MTAAEPKNNVKPIHKWENTYTNKNPIPFRHKLLGEAPKVMSNTTLRIRNTFHLERETQT
jgi:hypothetical protein